MQTAQRGIIRSAFFSGFGTLLSRFCGLAREMLMAMLFGTGMVADAFSVAFRFPNLLLRILGESGLRVVLLPRYNEERVQLGDEEAFVLASSVAVILSLLIGIVILLGTAFAPFLADIFAPGWRDEPEKFVLTVKLLRLLFPYIGFMALATWASTILNAHRKFFLPALSPAFMNLGWVAGLILVLLFYSGKDTTEQSTIVAVGILLGGALQFLFQLPAMANIKFRFKFNLRMKMPAILEMSKLMAPLLAALGIAELNFLVDVFLASYLVEGSVAALTYSSRLIYLPMGLASIAIATATLPELSDFAAKNLHQHFAKTLSFSFRTTLAIMLPISAYTIALSGQIVRFLFERGSFSGNVSTPMTAIALSMYATGLYAFSSFKVLTQGFYALKDTKTPVINAGIALLINIALNLLLIGPLKHAGLALASSIASIVQVFLLLIILNRRGVLNIKDELISFFRIALVSLSTGFITWFSAIFTEEFISGKSFPVRTAQLFIPTIIWLLVFLVLAYIFKIQEVNEFVSIVVQKVKRFFGERGPV